MQDQKEAPNAQAAACGNQPVTYIGEEEGALIARAVAQLDAQAQKADKELRNMDFAGRDLWFQVISMMVYLAAAVLTYSARPVWLSSAYCAALTILNIVAG